MANESTEELSEKEARVLALIEARLDRLTDLLRTLVRFQTPNPPGGNEREAQAWIGARLQELDMAVETFDALPGRPNVVGRLHGSGGGRSAMFNGHIDVAELRTPAAWTRPPYGGVVENGRMYGLGTSDMKSAHAGFLLALIALQEAACLLAGDVIYESVIGEERGEPGTRACVERGITADFAIVGECSKAETVFVSSVGVVNGRIEIRDPLTQHLIQRRHMVRAPGRLDGANCIDKMATKVIPALLELEQHWGDSKSHPLLPSGQALINVFAIDGGGNPFILPDSCRAFVTVVYLPGEDLEGVKHEVEQQLQAVAAEDGWLADHPATVEWNPPEFPVEFVPMDGSPRDPGATLLAKCLAATGGRPADVRGRDAIMDGGWLHQAGIPTVVFGPGDKSVIHRPDEYVELEDVLRYAKTIALFLLRWCGAGDLGTRR